MKILALLRFSMAALLVSAATLQPSQSHAQGAKALDVTLSTDRLVFSNDADQVVSGTMTNQSEDTVIISFKRYQKLPKGWTTSVCFGTNCFAAIVDTASEAFLPHESREFIMHVNPRMVDQPDSGWVYVRVDALTDNPGDTAGFLIHPIYEPGQPPIIFILTKGDTVKSFTGNGPFLMSETFQNRAADTVMFKYHLDAVVPEGWVPSMCLRDSCGTLTPSGVDIRYPMVSLVSQSVRMRLENPSGTPLPAPDSAILYLTIKPQTTNPADSMRYRFVAYLNPPSAVAEGKQAASHQLMLGSVYPNPIDLRQGDPQLKFATDLSSSANISMVLYDEAGKVVAQLPVGFVDQGVSTRSISLRNVDPGKYFARISDGVNLSNPLLVRIIR